MTLHLLNAPHTSAETAGKLLMGHFCYLVLSGGIKSCQKHNLLICHQKVVGTHTLRFNLPDFFFKPSLLLGWLKSLNVGTVGALTAFETATGISAKDA